MGFFTGTFTAQVTLTIDTEDCECDCHYDDCDDDDCDECREEDCCANCQPDASQAHDIIQSNLDNHDFGLDSYNNLEVWAGDLELAARQRGFVKAGEAQAKGIAGISTKEKAVEVEPKPEKYVKCPNTRCGMILTIGRDANIDKKEVEFGTGKNLYTFTCKFCKQTNTEYAYDV